jgi:hypothetical protein
LSHARRLQLGAVALVWCGLGMADRASAQISVRTGVEAHFATASEGAKILGQKDDFIERLSAFDRSARLKTDRAISEEEFLKFVRGNVLTWTDPEKEKIAAAMSAIQPALEKLPFSLPKKISLIKTTGAEEGGAFYTRDTAIVMPEKETGAASAESLQKTIAHELFHILSRANRELREKLYAVIGFTPCPEVELPADLRPRKITNPDAPRNDHAVKVLVAGKEVRCVPILFSKTEKYDPARGGEFFNYLEFKFLVPAISPAPAKVVGPEEVSGFFEQIGRNTDYIIHPEEILAENFAILVRGSRDVPSPEITNKIRHVLSE